MKQVGNCEIPPAFPHVSCLGEALGAMGCFDNQAVVDALTTQSRNPRAEVRSIPHSPPAIDTTASDSDLSNVPDRTRSSVMAREERIEADVIQPAVHNSRSGSTSPGGHRR